MENIINKEQQAYGFVHIHSTWSLQDAVAQIDDICKRAVEMGAKGIALTDHGNCAGWIKFITACQKYGLRSAPGVEGYYRFTPHGEYEGEEIADVYPVKHSHFILIAKDYEGYRQISHLITDAQSNCESIGGMMQPVFTKEMLAKHIKGGHVYATSACISGPLAAIYFSNKPIDKQIASKKRFQSNYIVPNRDELVLLQQRTEEIGEEIKALTEEQKDLKTKSKEQKKSLTMLKKGLKTLEKEYRRAEKAVSVPKKEDMLTEEIYLQAVLPLQAAAQSAKQAYEEALACYNATEETVGNITAKITEINKTIQTLKATKEAYKKEVSPYEKSLKKYKEFQDAIDVLEKKKHSREEIMVLIRNELEWLMKVFGKDFFIEMQYHGLDDEAEVMPVLAMLAEEYDVPLVAANDAHLVTKEQANARHILLSLRYSRWAEETPNDGEYYLKSDKELSCMLERILPGETVIKAMEGVRTIIDTCNVTIPKDTHFPKYRDDTGRTLTEQEAETLLKQLAEDGIAPLFPNGFPQNYRERLEYELEIIISMGFAHYFLIVWDYVTYAKNLARNTMGYGVGPGRGSGAGSLVLYLLGVTSIDPIVYNLIFERFLNPARVTMPDIDVDFSKEVREATIDYMRSKYGERLVARIRTVMVMGAKDSLHNAARVVGYRESYVSDGMTKEQKAEAEKRRKHIQNLGDRLAAEIQDPSVSLKDAAVRKSLCRAVPDALTWEIVEGAASIEGCAKSFSMHAGGVVISDGAPIDDYIPLMRVGSVKTDNVDDEMSMYDTTDRTIGEDEGQLATACDMIQLEETLKLLKFDFLGLNNLNVLSETARRVYRNYGKEIDWNMLPEEPEVIQNIYSSGKTGNVFQAESEGMRNMFIRMEPKSLEDIILGIAAYRPGPMEFIPEIIKVKQGETQPHYIIPELKDILSVTYGYPIYQEQLMDIFHKCAGFTLPDADNIRRLMSKKKKEEFIKFQPKFIYGITRRGATTEEAEQLWESLLGFASYAFNKAHAAVYAKISYATAYAKYHYPVEYMTSVLNWPAQRKHIPKILGQCRQMGIKILPPDIARSYMGFEDMNGKILYGLSVIKDTDTKSAGEIIDIRENNGYYRSFQEFIFRAHRKSSTTARLIESGAFDSISSVSRAALREALPKAIALKGEYDTACAKDGPASAQAKAKKTALLEMLIPDIEEDSEEKADREHNALGAYITSHPMDDYENVYRDGIRRLKDACEGRKMTYVGAISGFSIFHRSSDGAPFAKFVLEDKTGSIQCVMFTKAFANQDKSVLKNGAVVKVEGDVREESGDRKGQGNEQEDEQEEQVKTLTLQAQQVSPCRKTLNPFLVACPNEAYFTMFALPFLKECLSEDGHPCVLYEKDTGRTIPLTFSMSPSAMHMNIPGISIKSQRHG